jgi:hypothetical protein
MKLHATLLAACIAAAAAVPARAQTAPPPAPADSAARTAPAARPERVRRNPDLITAAEIAGTDVTDGWDLVNRYRPRWLRGIGASTGDEVVVYVNGGRLGRARELRQLEPTTVAEMRFVRGEEAVARWGTGHSAGVILVTLK